MSDNSPSKKKHILPRHFHLTIVVDILNILRVVIDVDVFHWLPVGKPTKNYALGDNSRC